MSIQPIAETGPPEIVALARGFNAMIDRLALAETRNRRLHDQLSTIQEEERAEIARDLHDEIGPYLFAMGVDAAAIQKTAEARGQSEIVGQIGSVREGVAHVQQQVKAILARLRSGNLVEFGLKQALENLTSFWQSRHGEVAISVTMTGMEGAFGEAFEGAIYRVVQESLNNAMRHGRPRRVTISIDASSRHEVLVEVADDGSGFKRSLESRGLGVRGMIERVTALGGDLDIQERKNGQGVVVTARLPYPRDAGNGELAA
jgi:two-component system sensor histidine kinase UhpB